MKLDNTTNPQGDTKLPSIRDHLGEYIDQPVLAHRRSESALASRQQPDIFNRRSSQSPKSKYSWRGSTTSTGPGIWSRSSGMPSPPPEYDPSSAPPARKRLPYISTMTDRDNTGAPHTTRTPLPSPPLYESSFRDSPPRHCYDSHHYPSAGLYSPPHHHRISKPSSSSGPTTTTSNNPASLPPTFGQQPKPFYRHPQQAYLSRTGGPPRHPARPPTFPLRHQSHAAPTKRTRRPPRRTGPRNNKAYTEEEVDFIRYHCCDLPKQWKEIVVVFNHWSASSSSSSQSASSPSGSGSSASSGTTTGDQAAAAMAPPLSTEAFKKGRQALQGVLYRSNKKVPCFSHDGTLVLDRDTGDRVLRWLPVRNLKDRPWLARSLNLCVLFPEKALRYDWVREEDKEEARRHLEAYNAQIAEHKAIIDRGEKPQVSSKPAAGYDIYVDKTNGDDEAKDQDTNMMDSDSDDSWEEAAGDA